MLETTYVTPEKAAEMLGTSVEMVLLAGAEGRIQFYGLNRGASRVSVKCYSVGDETEEKERENMLWSHDFLPITEKHVANVIRTGTTGEVSRFIEVSKDQRVVIARQLFEAMSFNRQCIYVLRDDIQAIIDSKQTPPAGSVPSEEAVMQLSSQKSRAANNDSRILAAVLAHFKINPADRGVVTLAAVLAHFGIDPGKRGQVKQIASWIDQRNPVSEDTVLDRLKKAKEILDKKSRTRPPA